MKANLKSYLKSTKLANQYIKNKFRLKKAPSTHYNKQIFRRNTTNLIDIEKAHYEAELLLSENYDPNSIKSQTLFEKRKISVFKFHCHFMQGIDWFFLILAIIGIIIGALASPLLSYLNSIIFTKVGNTSEDRTDLTAEEIMKLNVKDTMNSNIKYHVIFGCIELVGNIIGYGFFGLLSKRCIYYFKKRFFSLILSQEQGWFDTANVYEFATKIQSQIEYMELGLGSRLGNFIMDFFIGISAIIFAFFGSWKLSLVLLCFSPIAILVSIMFNRVNVNGYFLVLQRWELTGGIAEEIFYNIRAIASFVNFDYELKKFKDYNRTSTEIELMVNCRTKILQALFVLLEGLVIFVGIIYGRSLIGKDINSFKHRDITGGDIALTFSNIATFIASIGKMTFSYQYIQLALSATSDYFNLYERRPEMDLTNSKERPYLHEIKGKVEYKNVQFSYPSDDDNKLVLDRINLNFEPGQNVTLIGETGSGKTTITLLLQRLYDVTGGEILLDGIDIRRYDIQYLRNLIGYVSQNPVLFNQSIRENIIFGREKYIKNCLRGDLDQLINDACEKAHVNEFINTLPNGLDFVVGLKGVKLSGGQKQRIAIARAILTKPKILIFDEATSLLDNKSQKIITKAINNIIKENITTITIAHRFSTIKNADKLYLIKNGKVVDHGTHEELLKKGGYYFDIIRNGLLSDELKMQKKIEKLNTQKSGIVSVKTKVKFEDKSKEIAKSPEDIHLGYLTLVKDLWENYKWILISALLASIAYGVLPPFVGFIKGECIKALNSNYKTKRYDDSRKYSIIYLILAFLDTIMNFLSNWLLYALGIKLAKYYRNQAMKKYLSFHLSYYDLERNSPGTILTNMSLNTVQMKMIIQYALGSFVISFAIIITCLIIGCIYEYRLTLITIAFLPFIMIINLLRKVAMPNDKKKSLRNLEAGAIISGCFTNTKTIFAYNFQKKALELYLDANANILKQQVINEFINGIIVGITLFANFAKNAALFAATKRYVLNDTMDSDELTIIQSLLGSGFTKISGLMKELSNIKKGIGSAKTFYSVFETPSLIPHCEEENIYKLSPKDIKGKIELKHVYFAYPLNPERVALKDINMTILPGQKVALVGYSGSGKSTIIKILNRFYDVEDDKGEILIDDVNIKDYNLYELRKKIGIISPEPSIFKTSILENIRYGNLDATDEECIEAAKQTDVIKLLEKEKQGEKVKNKYGLSGGERQKISITRILLKDPTILMLDRATSALDKESEIEIEKSLDKLSKNKTTIIVTDKFDMTKKCDKIFVFDKGRIYEEGTHDELMKLKKRYYTLYKYSNLNENE